MSLDHPSIFQQPFSFFLPLQHIPHYSKQPHIKGSAQVIRITFFQDNRLLSFLCLTDEMPYSNAFVRSEFLQIFITRTIGNFKDTSLLYTLRNNNRLPNFLVRISDLSGRVTDEMLFQVIEFVYSEFEIPSSFVYNGYFAASKLRFLIPQPIYVRFNYTLRP